MTRNARYHQYYISCAKTLINPVLSVQSQRALYQGAEGY